MSRLRGGLFLGGLFIAAGQCLASPPGGPIDPGRSVAGIELGMKESRVQAILGEPKIQGDEARHYPKFHLTVFVREKVVTGVMLVKACGGPEPFPEWLEWAESAKTREGVGLGSSAAEVRRALGTPEHERRIEASVTMDVLSYPSRGISFQVSEAGACVITVLPPRETKSLVSNRDSAAALSGT